MSTTLVEPQDPREQAPKPEYPREKTAPPGLESEMTPTADTKVAICRFINLSLLDSRSHCFCVVTPLSAIYPVSPKANVRIFLSVRIYR